MWTTARATISTSILDSTAIDPVGAGLADSLARPGGNVTGVALLQPEISGKALSLLKEVFDVIADDATTRAAAGYLAEINAVFLGHATCKGRGFEHGTVGALTVSCCTSRLRLGWLL